MSIFAAEYLFLQKVTPAAINAKIALLNTLYNGKTGYPAGGVPNITQVADGTVFGPLDPQINPPALLYIIGLHDGVEELKRNQKSDLVTRMELLYVSAQDTYANAKVDTQVTQEALLFVMETLENVSMGTNPDRGVILVQDPDIELVSIEPTMGTTASTKYGFRAVYEVELRIERTASL